MKNTQTSREILNNEEAVLLTYMLRDLICIHPVWFAQALFSTATPLVCDELELLIEHANRLRSEKQNEDDLDTHNYIIETIRSMNGRRIIDDPYNRLMSHRKYVVKDPKKLSTKARTRIVKIATYHGTLNANDGVLAISGERLNRVRKPKGETNEK